MSHEGDPQSLRLIVATEKGLDHPDLIGRLHGETREEIEADAESLKAALHSTKPEPPSFDGGARTPVVETDHNADINAEIRAMSDGVRSKRTPGW